MSLPRKALGTVSALVALAAGASQAEGGVILSSWSSVVIPKESPSLVIDMNGDDEGDFKLFANDTHISFDGSETGAVVASTSANAFRFYSQGETIDFDDQDSGEVIQGLTGTGIQYLGVQFSVASEVYTGWLKFDFTDAENPILLSGGWESIPGMSITAIPEPSTFVFGAMGGVVLAAAWRKRRK